MTLEKNNAVTQREHPAETAHFYRAYLGRVGPEAAARLKPWLGPMRRLT
jgi:hypothetical protein